MKRDSFKVVFLDRDTSFVEGGKKLAVILSPAFYWFHKEKLDISLSQAKKIAPSMFEGMVPEGEYSYYVEKVGDEYHFFAYKDEEILNKFGELGIKPSAVFKVYPAQLVFGGLKEPLAIGDKAVLQEDGTVLVVPKNLVGLEVKETDLNSLKLPKRSLPLKAYSKLFISEDHIYALSILLFAAILLYAIQAFFYKKDLAYVKAKEMELIERYNLPTTTIQLKSILASLHKIQKEQLKIRENTEYILRAPLLPMEYIKRLDYGKKIVFEIVLSSKARAEAVKKYLQKRLALEDLSMSGNILRVESRR